MASLSPDVVLEILAEVDSPLYDLCAVDDNELATVTARLEIILEDYGYV